MDAMTDERVALAWQHHCEGTYAEAERLCREILREDPEDVGAWRLLGEACLFQGKHEGAVDAYRQARRRIQLAPEDLNNLGVSLVAQGKPGEAEEAYREALSLRPDYSRGLSNLGVALFKQEKLEEAAACHRRALEVNPDESRAYDGLAYTLTKAERLDELVDFLREALRSNPDRAEAHHALGLAWAARGHWDEAVQSHRRALELRSDYADAHCDLGIAILELDELDEAAARFRHAIALNPVMAEFRNNLGNALLRQGKPDEALSCFEEALGLKPDYPDCRSNRASTLLQLGDYERGWAEFEWRWRGSDFDLQITRPLWDGSPLAGRTILLIAEQGLGDTLQFIRYAALVKQRGGTVVVACQEPLLPLLESCPGIDRLAAHGKIQTDFDVYAPLMSLPAILGTTLETVPAPIPYLHARPELVESWRRELRSLGRFLVGVAWQGSPTYAHDRLRSFHLAQLEPLARLPGVTLISLQKGLGAEQVREVSDRFSIVDLSDRIDRETGPFLDTAAIMQSLDLVIGCDSALVHLAGALGVPVWIAHTFVCDWRWMVGREDSPWYPTARLFRQTSLGDWEGVFSRMAKALSDRLSAQPAISSVPIEVAPGELLDKITILELKSERITDQAKLPNICRELTVLTKARDRTIPCSRDLDQWIRELKAVNAAIWEVEDEIRECERQQDFGHRFVELARSVYRNNDRRAALKRRINNWFGSAILEEKGYRAYERTQHDAA
jgi:tetratricopeptide (TPR) repeat protein